MSEYIFEVDTTTGLNIYAGELVRCKDCKYYTESIYFAPDKVCYRYKDNEGNKIGYIKSGNDYCSAGVRRKSK